MGSSRRIAGLAASRRRPLPDASTSPHHAKRCGSLRTIVSADQVKLAPRPGVEAQGTALPPRGHDPSPRHFVARRGRGAREDRPRGQAAAYTRPTKRVALPLSQHGREAVRGLRGPADHGPRPLLRLACGRSRPGRSLASARFVRHRASQLRPNVLVIITDDQRLEGSMAVMPSTRHEFVDLGITSSNAFATTPLCCPSRASIFSGKYPHNHGIRVNNGRRASTPRRAGPATSTMPAISRASSASTSRPSRLARSRISTAPLPFRQSIPTTRAFLSAQASSFLEQAESDDSRPWALVVARANPHAPWIQRPQTVRATAAVCAPALVPEPTSATSTRPSPRSRALCAPWPRLAVKVRDGQRTELQQTDEMVASVIGTSRPRSTSVATPSPSTPPTTATSGASTGSTTSSGRTSRAFVCRCSRAGPAISPRAAVDDRLVAQHRPCAHDHAGRRRHPRPTQPTADPCSGPTTVRGCCSRARR